MLGFRLRGILKWQESSCQASFRRGFFTVDHLHTIKMITQKAIEYRVTNHWALIDFTKFFDLLDHECVLRALLNHGVGTTVVKLIQEIYADLQAKIITDIEAKALISEGWLDRATQCSRYYSTVPYDEIFTNFKWETKGIKINGDLINNLRFVNDVVLVAGCWVNVQN